MSGGTLKVNPAVLKTAATSFGQAGDGLAGMRVDAPLGDAAGAVPQLQTADACREAESNIAAQTTAVADGARKFSGNLTKAASWYQKRDHEAADAIKKTALGEIAAVRGEVK